LETGDPYCGWCSLEKRWVSCLFSLPVFYIYLAMVTIYSTAIFIAARYRWDGFTWRKIPVGVFFSLFSKPSPELNESIVC
jgi:hypothetical protein